MDNQNLINITESDINEVADNIIVQNFMKFQDSMSTAEIFVMEKASLTLYQNSGLAVLPLKKQHMMDDMLQMLSDHLNVCVLYDCSSRNEREKKVVLYSLPVIDEMFVITLDSMQYGITDEVCVTFFSSLEIMFAELRKGLENASIQEASQETKMNEKQSLTTLFSQFL